MSSELLTICLILFGLVLLGVFALLGDERPPRLQASDRERAMRWLYERLFLTVLLAAMVVALFVIGPYLLVSELS